MPIDLVIDERDGGSTTPKSGTESQDHTDNSTDQVRHNILRVYLFKISLAKYRSINLILYFILSLRSTIRLLVL